MSNKEHFLNLWIDLKHVIYYADDIMIATDKSLSHHIEIIEKVLDCFEKANIKNEGGYSQTLLPHRSPRQHG